MPPIQDYLYRYPGASGQMGGRCRVRIYKRTGGQTVLLTEPNNNPGEPVVEASARIATDLAARWQLNLRTTRWVVHDATHPDAAARFDEVEFSWDAQRVASKPRWRAMSGVEAAALTGENVAVMNRGIGDVGQG
jgi:hypothetical protein